MRQILVNLLANAVKFTSSHDAEPGRVTVSAGAAKAATSDANVAGDGPWVYIRVEDTGRGIHPDQLHAVFEPFVQADMTLTREHGGTGLGLAISRRLARLMGGDLTVRSEPGMGSAFFLWLPAAPVESSLHPCFFLDRDGYLRTSRRETRATGQTGIPGKFMAKRCV